jgi:voltage-gated potassium channel
MAVQDMGALDVMLIQLALASLMAIVTVLIHLFGLALIIRLIRSEWPLLRRLRVSPLSMLLVATIGVFAAHTVEIWLYSLLYLAIGAFDHFEVALYFSTVTYASIGYGDVLMPHGWRLLGAIEGVTGIIMLGWSTAFLVSLLSPLKLFGHDWLAAKP